MKELFWKIFNCESEVEVSKVIAASSLLNNSKNWKAYGNNPGNFGTFENQQNNPIPALIEKITNSIDAILLKECKKRGTDPRSKEAPKRMNDSVEIFFGIKNGDFSEVIKSKRRVIAENIQVISVGEKATPSIIIYDDGEGQEPKNFAIHFYHFKRIIKQISNLFKANIIWGQPGLSFSVEKRNFN